MEWHNAGHDFATKSENVVFRLHKEYITLKRPHTNEKQEMPGYDLQYRKLDNLDFKSLGYFFFIENTNYGFSEEKSVDEKVWKKVEAIMRRSEDILRGLYYI